MSKFKFSENLFIGRQELNRFMLFMRDQGFVRNLLANSLSFGIVRNSPDFDFLNAKVISGDTPGNIRINPILAIDADGQAIFTSQQLRGISIPDDGNWHWIKISHSFSAIEKGTVSVDVNGNLTGVGTEFTEIFRGQPNFPSRIKFVDAQNNLSEYDVASVIDDENAILQGAFQNEAELQFQIVGTFTPGSFPSEPEKFPFQYDACEVNIIEESNLVSIDEDREFYLARVKNDSGTVEIEDKRSSVFRTRSDFRLWNMDREANPLIGVEGVTFGTKFSALNQNAMILSWAFRSNNWTIETTLNTLTILGGNGGKFKDTSYFTNGDFNGWRLYTEDGEYAKILNSTKSGSQINLVLDFLDADRFTNQSQTVLVTPDAESIQIILKSGTSNPVPNRTLDFPINMEFARFYVEVYSSPQASWNIQYKYRNFDRYTEPRTLPEDTVGFLNEFSYDSDGQLLPPGDRQSVPYAPDPVNGYIPLTLNQNNHLNRINSLDTGTIFGVERQQLDNSNPLIQLDPDSSPRYQVITAQAGFTLTVDHFINLNIANAIEGAEFLLDFRAPINLDTFQLRIVQGYNNPGDFGTVLVDFDQFLATASDENRLFIRLTYESDQIGWIAKTIVSSIPFGNVTYNDLDTNLQNSIDSIPNVVTVTVADTAPPSPVEGDIWIDTSV